MHAEATSEKGAMGWFLDGKVSAVVGSHTHVQTADERVLPGGTAYLTDAGMCGPIDSVIGVKTELAIRRFRTHMPTRFEAATGTTVVQGAVVDVDPTTGRAHRDQARAGIRRPAMSPREQLRTHPARHGEHHSAPRSCSPKLAERRPLRVKLGVDPTRSGHPPRSYRGAHQAPRSSRISATRRC